jgi:hypothetical protein
MPDWLVHTGDWIATVVAGALTLIGVILGLRTVSRQIEASRQQQADEFKDRDKRRLLSDWERTRTSAAVVRAELELQYQLIFQRRIGDEISMFCNSLESGGPVSIPQPYDIYDPLRVFGQMEAHVSNMPSWLITFFVRYMGLLHYELTRFVQTMNLAKTDPDLLKGWATSSIQSIRNAERTFNLLKGRCEALIRIAGLINDSGTSEEFQLKVTAEKLKLAVEDSADGIPSSK